MIKIIEYEDKNLFKETIIDLLTKGYILFSSSIFTHLKKTEKIITNLLQHIQQY